MRKLKFFLIFFLAACLLIAPAGRFRAAAEEADKYYIGGMTAGFMLAADGAEVIGLTEVAAEDGLHRPAEEAGIRVGDTVVAADGIRIKTIADLNGALERSGGKCVTFTVRRKGDTAQAEVTPVKDKKSGKYKIGVLIRDTLAGIGTVTYINK